MRHRNQPMELHALHYVFFMLPSHYLYLHSALMRARTYVSYILCMMMWKIPSRVPRDDHSCLTYIYTYILYAIFFQIVVQFDFPADNQFKYLITVFKYDCFEGSSSKIIINILNEIKSSLKKYSINITDCRTP